MDPKLKALWAEKIRGARKRSGLTQKDAGALCGVNQTTFSRWERGELVPSEQNKVIIAAWAREEPRDMFPLTLPDLVPTG